MLARVSGNIRYIVLALLLVSLGFFAVYSGYLPQPLFPPGSPATELQPMNTPCPEQVKCKSIPCVCPSGDEPCPEVTAPPVIAHPCPVPEPCPEVNSNSPKTEREKHRWNGRTVTTGPSPWQEVCVWKKVNFASEVSFDMCVRGYSDIVSDVIRGQGGRWGDCDVLVSMWQQTPRAAKAVREHDTEGIFVDAGANIGACTLLMAAVGHTTIGFEPLRANLFYLTSGILGNTDAIREKITLYEMGLGTHTLNASAWAASGNAGNTQLDSMVKDWGSQTWRKESYIPVMSLDDVLWPDPTTPPPHVRLMKMDVQGYEVKILKGARRLLEAGAIGIVKSELTSKFLAGQGSSAQEMVKLMLDNGYELTGHYEEKVDPVKVRDGEVVFRYVEKLEDDQ